MAQVTSTFRKSTHSGNGGNCVEVAVAEKAST